MRPTTETIISLYEKFLECGGRICTDSRHLERDSIFFALRGGSFDGNTFAIEALRQGAAWAVVDDPETAGRAAEDGPAISSHIILVDNVLDALQRLAAHHRYELDIPILAITGSNGKTTTKELISRVLSRRYEVSTTVGNLNNHIGVPLTLLAMDVTTGFGVVEMGASARDEIALLCRIAQPNFGIITNIGLAHLEGFGGAQGVVAGKGELYDYLAGHGGVAFFRENDPTLAVMASSRENLHAISYPDAPEGVTTSLEGDYNMLNIAAAIAVGDHFDIPRLEIFEAIASYRPDNNRSQVIITDNNKLIADSYNANPSSMRAALMNFAGLRDSQYPQKTVILGDMLELGKWSHDEHGAILEILSRSDIEEIYLVGENFTRAANAAASVTLTPSEQDVDRPKPKTFPDTAALAEILRTAPVSGHTILLKGSRGMKLESLIPLL